MPGRLSFNTDNFPERERFPAFREEIVQRYMGLDLRTEHQVGFHAKLELRRAGPIDIGCMSTSAVNSARTASLVRDGDDSIIVTLLKRGSANQSQGEDRQSLAPSEAIVGDCAYPGELNFTSDTDFWNIRIPRQKLAPLLPPATRFAGIKLGDGSARRLLFSYIDSVCGIELNTDGRAAQLYGDHVVDLVALALGAGGDVRKAIEGRGARAARQSAILNEINLSIADPDLSAATIAGRLGVTPRYVRMLLEETGQSFSEHVMERRLQRAAALLCDPAHRHHRIADVAFACGFGDLSYFNRAFRRQFSATPSEMRAGARPKG